MPTQDAHQQPDEVSVEFSDGRCEAVIDCGVCERLRKGVARELNRFAKPYSLVLEIFVDEMGHRRIRLKPHLHGHAYQRTFRQLVRDFVAAYAPRLRPEAIAA